MTAFVDKMDDLMGNAPSPIDIDSENEEVLETTCKKPRMTRLLKPTVTTVLKRQRRLTSPIWEKFDVLNEPDKNGNLVAKCKKCAKVFNAESKNGTGNMIRHQKKCPGKSVRDIGQYIIQSNSAGSLMSKLPKFNPDEFRELLGVAIVKHNLPLQLVEYEGIRRCFSYLYSDVKFISRNTIKADILKIYLREKEKLIESLKKDCGRVSLTADCWSSLTTDGYMSLTAHYVENWQLQNRVLNFSFLPPPHSGAAMSVKVSALLKEWGIENNVMCLTLDNASSNDLMVDHLKSDLNLMCNGEYFHVRCCAHILNLIVQEGLKDLDGVVVKVRESVKYNKGSQTRKQRFMSCVNHVNLESSKGLRQDVPTRWNSTYQMLENALYYKKAFNHLARTDLNYLNCPTEGEWDKIENICKFLKVFYEVTCVFSGSKYPTSNLYFTHVLRVRLLLKDEMASREGFLKNMATRMFVKFEKYWSSFSTIMAIAIVLDPRYKFYVIDWAYKKIFTECYNLELDIFRDKLFALYNEYVSMQADSSLSSFNKSNSEVVDLAEGSSDTFMMDYDCYASNTCSAVSKSELELYLEEPTLPRNVGINVLDYWKTHCGRYPVLSLMARDILAIPISTVASESTFSIGGKILDPYRSSLKPSTVEALVCLRDWAFDQGLRQDVEELNDQVMNMEVGVEHDSE